jgi:quercetin dioxygenase-like cupin family protein
LADGNQKTVEKVIFDENVHYLHMIFGKDEGLSEHFSNSNIYITVLRGILSIGLNNQEINEYPKGTLLKIPVDTKMNVKNPNRGNSGAYCYKGTGVYDLRKRYLKYRGPYV